MRTKNISITIYPDPPNHHDRNRLEHQMSVIHKFTVVGQTKNFNDTEGGQNVLFHIAMSANTHCIDIKKNSSDVHTQIGL